MKKFILIIQIIFTGQLVQAQCEAPVSISGTIAQSAKCLGMGHIIVGTVTPAATTPDFFQYALYDATNALLVRDWQESNTFSTLSAGTYTIRVRKLCSTSPFISSTITQSVTVADAVVPLNLDSIKIIQEPACNDGIIHAIASGKAPLEYALVTSLSVSDAPSSFIRPRQSSPIFDSLDFGTYFVRVFDSCNNYVTKSIYVPYFDNYKYTSVNPTIKLGCDSFVFNFSIFGIRNEVLSSIDSVMAMTWVKWPNGTIDSQAHNLSNSFPFGYNHLEPSYTGSAMAFPDNLTGWPYPIVYGGIDACGDWIEDTFFLAKPGNLSYLFQMPTDMHQCDSLATLFNFFYNIPIADFDITSNFISINTDAFYSIDTGATWHHLSSDTTYNSGLSDIIYVSRHHNTEIIIAYCGDTFTKVVYAEPLPVLNTSIIQGGSSMNSCNDATVFTFTIGSNHFADSFDVVMLSAPMGQPILSPVRVTSTGNNLLYDNLMYGTYSFRLYDTLGLGDCGRYKDITVDLVSPVLNPSVGVHNYQSCAGKTGITFTNLIVRDSVSIKVTSAPAGQPLTTIWYKSGTVIPDYFKSLLPGSYTIEFADSIGNASGCPRVATRSLTVGYPVDLRATTSIDCTNEITVMEYSTKQSFNSSTAWDYLLRLKVYDSLGNTVYGGYAGMPKTYIVGMNTVWTIPSSEVNTWPAGPYYFRIFNSSSVDTFCSSVYDTMYIGSTLNLSSTSTISGCDGVANNMTIVGIANGGLAPHQYTLYRNSYSPDSLVAGPQYYPVFNGLNNTDIYYIRANDQCGSALVMEVSGNIVDFSPVILNYELMPCLGDSITIQVANLPSASYQWYKNGAILPGEVYASLEIDSLRDVDSGVYSVAIYAGSCSKVSPNIHVNPDQCGTPLNITSLQQNATLIGNQVKVSWAITDERGIVGYSIEHSNNARVYHEIGSKKSGALSYQLMHHYPISGVNYYRIKVLQEDGQYYYTSVMKVLYDGTHLVWEVTPNPATSVINISSQKATQATITIYDAAGKLMNKFSEMTPTTLDISSYPLGAYFIQIEADGAIHNKKIIKR